MNESNSNCLEWFRLLVALVGSPVVSIMALRDGLLKHDHLVVVAGVAILVFAIIYWVLIAHFLFSKGNPWVPRQRANYFLLGVITLGIPPAAEGVLFAALLILLADISVMVVKETLALPEPINIIGSVLILALMVMLWGVPIWALISKARHPGK